MNANTPNQVLSLPFTSKEQHHTSRNRIAYHVFLSMYFHDFKNLTIQEQMDEVGIGDDDDMSIHSTDTPPTIASYDVIRAAAKKWRGISKEMKEAWEQRVIQLNSQPRIDGRFEVVPLSLETNLQYHILASLTKEWQHLVSIFRNAATRQYNKRVDNRKEYVFGKERVRMHNQIYRSMFISELLLLTIFGSPLLTGLSNHELVHRSKNQVVIHLFSYRRISELLTFGGLSACNFQHRKLSTYNYCVGAKVTMNVRGKEATGYVIDEDDYANTLEVRMMMDDGMYDVVVVKRPVYDTVRGKYTYPERQSCDSITISQLCPYRIKLNIKSGQTSFICSAYNCTDNR